MPPESDVHDISGQDAKRSSDKITGGFAALVRVLHGAEQRGDLAALRRMDPEHPYEPPFQRMLVRVAPQTRLERAKRIALVAKILALPPSGEALNDGTRSFGRAMAEAGISEARVQVLMTARGGALDDAVLRLARRLVRTGSLPFFEIGRLVLGGEAEVEDTRYRIAHDYWTGRAERDGAGAAPIPSETGDIEE